MKPSEKSRRAFTLAELLVSVCAVVLVLWLCMENAYSPGKGKAQRIKCINNLKNAALAVRIFATDNDLLSEEIRTAQRVSNLVMVTAADYFRAFSNELSTPKIVTCPADSRVVESTNFATLSNLNVSFFANQLAKSGDPEAFLFGDRNLQTNGTAISGGSLRLTPNLSAAWTKEIHVERGDVALGDGSVQQFTNERLLDHLRNSRIATNLLLIP